MKKLFLSLLVFTAPVYADPTATVVALRSPAFVNDTELTRETIVEEGNTITTKSQGFVVLQFYDGARVTVRPNSTLVIAQYSEEVELDLVSGGLRIITGAITKNNPENFRVSTKTALMGVRGTEFSIQLVEE